MGAGCCLPGASLQRPTEVFTKMAASLGSVSGHPPKCVLPRWHALPHTRVLVPRCRALASWHGECSLLRQSHLPWNLPVCKWERFSVVLWLKWGEIHQPLVVAGTAPARGAGLPSALLFGGKGVMRRPRGAGSAVCHLGQAALSLVSFLRSFPEDAMRCC